MTLNQLRNNITSDELTLWRAFELTEGFPVSRAEVATAISGAAICNSWGAKVKPKDLIPDFRPKEVTQKQGLNMFKAWVTAHNSLVKPTK
jgi:hypothetical protein